MSRGNDMKIIPLCRLGARLEWASKKFQRNLKFPLDNLHKMWYH
nr:MAG TPA: hypothetical protein [Caudoviricetes sp.]